MSRTMKISWTIRITTRDEPEGVLFVVQAATFGQAAKAAKAAYRKDRGIRSMPSGASTAFVSKESD